MAQPGRGQRSVDAILRRARDPFGWGVSRDHSYTRAAVEAAVTQLFPTHDPTTILAILDEYGTQEYQRERLRVQLAILKLSRGDPDALRARTRDAQRDYRDILMWADQQDLRGEDAGVAFLQALNRGTLDVALPLLDEGFLAHIPAGLPLGREAFWHAVLGTLAAFPDGQWTYHERLTTTFGSEQTVALRGTFRATHRGEVLGVPATGKPVTVPWMVTYRVGADGRLREAWGLTDRLGLLRQLGATPEQERPASPRAP